MSIKHFLLSLMLWSTIQAQQYWIEKNSPGCSDVGPGTLDRPWCSVDVLDESHGRKRKPGDVVTIKRGEYTLQRQVMLFSPGPVTLRGEAGAVVRYGTRRYEAAIQFQAGADNWTVEGLKVVGYIKPTLFTRLYCPELIAAQSCSGLNLRSLTLGPVQGGDDVGIPDRPNPHWGAAIHLSGCRNSTIACCTVEATVRPLKDQSAADAILLDGCQQCDVWGCTVGACGHIGINLRASTLCAVIANKVHNPLHTAICAQTGSDDCQISGNVISHWDTQPQWTATPGLGIELVQTSRAHVFNNRLTSATPKKGITLTADPSIGTCEEIIMQANTLENATIELSRYGADGVAIKNAIIYQCRLTGGGVVTVNVPATARVIKETQVNGVWQ